MKHLSTPSFAKFDMDDFEARINACLEAIENGTGELIEGLYIPRVKAPINIEQWARRLATETSGLGD